MAKGQTQAATNLLTPPTHLKFSYVVWLVATSQVWKPLRPHTNQKKMNVKIISAIAAPL